MAVAGLLALMAVPAMAQTDPASLSDADLLAALDQLDSLLAPSTRLALYGIPSGYGAPHGLAFASLSGTNRRNRGRLGDWDGSLGFGIGLGDAERAVAVVPVVTITSVSAFHFGSSGTIGLSVHRAFDSPFGPASLGLGADNLIRWGESSALEQGTYVAGSVLMDWGVPVFGSLGYGNQISDLGRRPGVFGGLAIALGGASGSLAWSGDEVIAGLTLWPEPSGRAQVSIGIGDLTHRVDGQRLLFSVSFAQDVFHRR